MDRGIFRDLNLVGTAIGFVFWIILVWFLAEDSECAKYHTCGSGDLVQISIISLGFIVPAGIVALLASILVQHFLSWFKKRST